MTKLARLVEALRRLKSNGDPAVIEQAAGDILVHMSLLKAAQAEADRIASVVGPAKELRDLERAARKAIGGKLDNARWAAAWAKTHSSIRRRVLRPKAPIVVRNKRLKDGVLVFARAPMHDVIGSFRVEGFSTLVPKPKAVLSGIQAEQKRIEQTASAERRKRKRDQAEAAAIKSIRSAYQKLTGKKGARSTDANKRLTGRFVRLGRNVDQIFDTKLFAAKDSRRLR